MPQQPPQQLDPFNQLYRDLIADGAEIDIDENAFVNWLKKDPSNQQSLVQQLKSNGYRAVKFKGEIMPLNESTENPFGIDGPYLSEKKKASESAEYRSGAFGGVTPSPSKPKTSLDPISDTPEPETIEPTAQVIEPLKPESPAQYKERASKWIEEMTGQTNMPQEEVAKISYNPIVNNFEAAVGAKQPESAEETHAVLDYKGLMELKNVPEQIQLNVSTAYEKAAADNSNVLLLAQKEVAEQEKKMQLELAGLDERIAALKESTKVQDAEIAARNKRDGTNFPGRSQTEIERIEMYKERVKAGYIHDMMDIEAKAMSNVHKDAAQAIAKIPALQNATTDQIEDFLLLKMGFPIQYADINQDRFAGGKKNSTWLSEGLSSIGKVLGQKALAAEKTMNDIGYALSGAVVGYDNPELVAQNEANNKALDARKEALEIATEDWTSKTYGGFVDKILSGDVSAAGYELGNTIGTSMPDMLMSALVTKGLGPGMGLATLGASNASQTYWERDYTRRHGSLNLTKGEVIASSILDEGFESIGEYVGGAIIARGATGLLGSESVSALLKAEGAKSMVAGFGKELGIAFVEEGLAEGATQLLQGINSRAVEEMSKAREKGEDISWEQALNRINTNGFATEIMDAVSLGGMMGNTLASPSVMANTGHVLFAYKDAEVRKYWAEGIKVRRDLQEATANGLTEEQIAELEKLNGQSKAVVFDMFTERTRQFEMLEQPEKAALAEAHVEMVRIANERAKKGLPAVDLDKDGKRLNTPNNKRIETLEKTVEKITNKAEDLYTKQAVEKNKVTVGSDGVIYGENSMVVDYNQTDVKIEEGKEAEVVNAPGRGVQQVAVNDMAEQLVDAEEAAVKASANTGMVGRFDRRKAMVKAINMVDNLTMLTRAAGANIVIAADRSEFRAIMAEKLNRDRNGMSKAQAGLAKRALRSDSFMYDEQTNTVYISPQAYKSNVYAHEMMHPILKRLENSSPELFAKLAGEVAELKALSEGVSYKEWAKRSGYAEGQVNAEMLTEFMADILTTPNGPVRRAEKKFRDFMHKIDFVLTGNTSGRFSQNKKLRAANANYSPEQYNEPMVLDLGSNIGLAEFTERLTRAIKTPRTQGAELDFDVKKQDAPVQVQTPVEPVPAETKTKPASVPPKASTELNMIEPTQDSVTLDGLANGTAEVYQNNNEPQAVVKETGGFFTPHNERYSEYGANKHTVGITMKNPFIRMRGAVMSSQEIADLRAQGYDGIITHPLYGQVPDSELNLNQAIELVAFDQSQITQKSSQQNKAEKPNQPAQKEPTKKEPEPLEPETTATPEEIELERLAMEYEQASAEFNLDDSLEADLNYEEMDRQIKAMNQEARTEGGEVTKGDYKQNWIHQHLRRFPNKSWDRFSDPNYRKDAKAFNLRFTSDKGLPIDVQAQEMSSESGVEITPNDIVDYVLDRLANPSKYTASTIAQAQAITEAYPTAEEALAIYSNLKTDPNAVQAIEKLRGKTLSDEQADLLINYIKLIHEKNGIKPVSNAKPNEGAQRGNENSKGSKGVSRTKAAKKPSKKHKRKAAPGNKSVTTAVSPQAKKNATKPSVSELAAQPDPTREGRTQPVKLTENGELKYSLDQNDFTISTYDRNGKRKRVQYRDLIEFTQAAERINKQFMAGTLRVDSTAPAPRVKPKEAVVEPKKPTRTGTDLGYTAKELDERRRSGEAAKIAAAATSIASDALKASVLNTYSGKSPSMLSDDANKEFAGIVGKMLSGMNTLQQANMLRILKGDASSNIVTVLMKSPFAMIAKAVSNVKNPEAVAISEMLREQGKKELADRASSKYSIAAPKNMAFEGILFNATPGARATLAARQLRVSRENARNAMPNRKAIGAVAGTLVSDMARNPRVVFHASIQSPSVFNSVNKGLPRFGDGNYFVSEYYAAKRSAKNIKGIAVGVDAVSLVTLLNASTVDELVDAAKNQGHLPRVANYMMETINASITDKHRAMGINSHKDIGTSKVPVEVLKELMGNKAELAYAIADAETNALYETKPKVMPAVLNIKNPVRIGGRETVFEGDQLDALAAEAKKYGDAGVALADMLTAVDEITSSGLITYAENVVSDNGLRLLDGLVGVFQAMGYDGVIDVTQDSRVAPQGQNSIAAQVGVPTEQYMVFDPKSVVLLNSENTTRSPKTNNRDPEIRTYLYSVNNAKDVTALLEQKSDQEIRSKLGWMADKFMPIRGDKPIGFNYESDMVARERFDLSGLKKLGSGSDRTVFDLNETMVLKVAHSARGLEQNITEGDYYLSNLLPEVFERGLNYVVAEKVKPLTKKDRVPLFVDGDPSGETVSVSDFMEDMEWVNRHMGGYFGNRRPDESAASAVLDKYGMQDFMSYDMLWADFTNIENWGLRDGAIVHLDGGTLGGTQMITSYRDKKNMDNADFRNVYYASKAARKKYNDNSHSTKYSIAKSKGLDRALIANQYAKHKSANIENDFTKEMDELLLSMAVNDMSIELYPELVNRKTSDLPTELNNVERTAILAEKRGVQLPSASQLNAYSIARHGSPFRFDYLSLGKRGKGEGGEATGSGIYVTIGEQNDKVIANYAGYHGDFVANGELVNSFAMMSVDIDGDIVLTDAQRSASINRERNQFNDIVNATIQSAFPDKDFDPKNNAHLDAAAAVADNFVRSAMSGGMDGPIGASVYKAVKSFFEDAKTGEYGASLQRTDPTEYTLELRKPTGEELNLVSYAEPLGREDYESLVQTLENALMYEAGAQVVFDEDKLYNLDFDTLRDTGEIIYAGESYDGATFQRIVEEVLSDILPNPQDVSRLLSQAGIDGNKVPVMYFNSSEPVSKQLKEAKKTNTWNAVVYDSKDIDVVSRKRIATGEFDVPSVSTTPADELFNDDLLYGDKYQHYSLAAQKNNVPVILPQRQAVSEPRMFNIYDEPGEGTGVVANRVEPPVAPSEQFEVSPEIEYTDGSVVSIDEHADMVTEQVVSNLATGAAQRMSTDNASFMVTEAAKAVVESGYDIDMETPVGELARVLNAIDDVSEPKAYQAAVRLYSIAKSIELVTNQAALMGMEPGAVRQFMEHHAADIYTSSPETVSSELSVARYKAPMYSVRRAGKTMFSPQGQALMEKQRKQIASFDNETGFTMKGRLIKGIKNLPVTLFNAGYTYTSLINKMAKGATDAAQRSELGGVFQYYQRRKGAEAFATSETRKALKYVFGVHPEAVTADEMRKIGTWMMYKNIVDIARRWKTKLQKYQNDTSAAIQGYGTLADLKDAKNKMTVALVSAQETLKDLKARQVLVKQQIRASNDPATTAVLTRELNILDGQIIGLKSFLDDLQLRMSVLKYGAKGIIRYSSEIQNPFGITSADAEAELDYVRNNDPEGYAAMEEIATRWQDVTQKLLDEKLASGMITQAMFDGMVDYFYFPRAFLGHFIDRQFLLELRGVDAGVLKGSHKGIVTLKEGSEDALINDPVLLLSGMIMTHERNKSVNEMIVKLHDYVENNPAAAKTFGISVPKPRNNGAIPAPADGNAQVTGFINGNRVAIEMPKGVAASMLGRPKQAQTALTVIMLSSVLKTFATATSLAFSVANFFYDSMSAVLLTEEFAPPSLGLAGKWLPFKTINAAGFYARALPSMMRMAFTSPNMKKPSIIQEMYEAGVGMDFLFYDDKDGVARMMKANSTGKLRAVAERSGAMPALSYLFATPIRAVAATELSTRTAIYLARKKHEMKKNGGIDNAGVRASAAAAARGYMDFGVSGTATRTFEALSPYFNATFRGLDLLVTGISPALANKVFASHYTGDKTGLSYYINPMTLLNIATAMTGKMLFNYLVNTMLGMADDDDEPGKKMSPVKYMSQVSDYDKETYLIIPRFDPFEAANGNMVLVKDERGRYKYDRIPFAPDMRPFVRLADMLAQQMGAENYTDFHKNNKEAMARKTGDMIPFFGGVSMFITGVERSPEKTLGEVAAAPTFSAILALLGNYDTFTGKKIDNKRQDILPEDRINDNTRRTFIALGNAVNMNPTTLQAGAEKIVGRIDNNQYINMTVSTMDHLIGSSPRDYDMVHKAPPSTAGEWASVVLGYSRFTRTTSPYRSSDQDVDINQRLMEENSAVYKYEQMGRKIAYDVNAEQRLSKMSDINTDLVVTDANGAMVLDEKGNAISNERGRDLVERIKEIRSANPDNAQELVDAFKKGYIKERIKDSRDYYKVSGYAQASPSVSAGRLFNDMQNMSPAQREDLMNSLNAYQSLGDARKLAGLDGVSTKKFWTELADIMKEKDVQGFEVGDVYWSIEDIRAKAQ